MQLKKIVFISFMACSSVFPALSSAESGAFNPMSLWQRDSCTVDGVAAGDVNLMDGQPKNVVCTWQEGDPDMEITLHVGQIAKVNAICRYTHAEGSFNVISDIYGNKSSTITNKNLHSTPMTFTVNNDLTDPNLNVLISLNAGNKFTQLKQWVSRTKSDFTPGDTMSCLFKPMA